MSDEPKADITEGGTGAAVEDQRRSDNIRGPDGCNTVTGCVIQSRKHFGQFGRTGGQAGSEEEGIKS